MNKKVLIVAAKMAGIFALLLLGIWKDLMPKEEPQKMTIDDIRSSRELSGVDDFRDGEWCPVCRSDNVHEIKYGLLHGRCMVGSSSKRYRCNRCGYRWGRLPEYIIYGERAFKEKSLCDNDATFYGDVDFDGTTDIVSVEDGKVTVIRHLPKTLEQQNVSKQVPYCWFAINRCCPAHQAFTTIDYVNKTIYIEAHYGSSDRSIRQFKKVGDGWKEVIPVKPMSKINEDLFPVSHLNKKKVGGKTIWYWGGRQKN